MVPAILILTFAWTLKAMTDSLGAALLRRSLQPNSNSFLDEIVELLHLKERLNAYPGELSGGGQQRVAIARALIAKPAILLADEPTGNLDSRTGQNVLGLLKLSVETYRQTLVMITHNLELAQMADRVVRIEDGRIRA